MYNILHYFKIIIDKEEHDNKKIGFTFIVNGVVVNDFSPYCLLHIYSHINLIK